MKPSNLAERLEQFEATLKSLRLNTEPGPRQMAPRDGSRQGESKSPRRSPRTGGIRIRDQGLPLFRVR